MSSIVSCDVCGNLYEAKNRASRYCSQKCRYAVANERAKIKYHKKKAYKNKPTPQKDVKTLEEWNKEARAAGMSYGQYRAMVELKGRM